MIVIDEDCPCKVTVRVSGPSVNLSAAIGMDMFATPLVPTVTSPVKEPEVISAALTLPEIVYVKALPEATPVVVTAKAAVEPSFAEVPAGHCCRE